MWNLFERIINAIRPSGQSQQTSKESQQPWNEENPEQQQSPQEPASVSQQDPWQDSE
jgi:hypothetical protein